MSRILKLALSLSLLASPLLAQPRASRDLAAPPGLGALLHADARLEEAVESRPLFYAPPADQLTDARKLEFRISLNREPYIEETLSLEPGKPGAFELLASQPALRDRLYQLAKQRSNKLAIQVLVDERLIQEFSSFREFLQYNRELKSKPFSPRQAASEVRDHTAPAQAPFIPPPQTMTAKGLQRDPACMEQCYADYDLCYDGGWGCDYGDCSRCQARLDDCEASCPVVCVDPKSVKDTTSSEVVGYHPYYQECREHWWENDFFDGEWYTFAEIVYKNTTVRRTEYCDGRVENQVIDVWYSSRTCWNRSYLECFYPVNKAYPTC